jgi:hypothetical protein
MCVSLVVWNKHPAAATLVEVNLAAGCTDRVTRPGSGTRLCDSYPWELATTPLANGAILTVKLVAACQPTTDRQAAQHP